MNRVRQSSLMPIKAKPPAGITIIMVMMMLAVNEKGRNVKHRNNNGIESSIDSMPFLTSNSPNSFPASV
jgi:hypothetical protein